MKVLDGTVHFGLVKVGVEMLTRYMLMSLDQMDRFDHKGEHQAQYEQYRDQFMQYVGFQTHLLSNRNPRPMPRSIFFSKFQKNWNSPNTQPKKTNKT